MIIYPEAKVILNVRDSADVWWTSFSDTIAPLYRWPYRISTFPLPFAREQGRLIRAMYAWRQQKGSWGPQWYQMHVDEVKSVVPKEKLLEFNVKEGWGPLCEFLDVPVPDKPFPKM